MVSVGPLGGAQGVAVKVQFAREIGSPWGMAILREFVRGWQRSVGTGSLHCGSVCNGACEDGGKLHDGCKLWG